jgi:hypothetical protein
MASSIPVVAAPAVEGASHTAELLTASGLRAEAAEAAAAAAASSDDEARHVIRTEESTARVTRRTSQSGRGGRRVCLRPRALTSSGYVGDA